MSEEIGERIEKLLQEKNGGNQSELARFVGVSPQAVQQWISGDTAPRGKNLKKVADFLGVSRAFLSYGVIEGEPGKISTVGVTGTVVGTSADIEDNKTKQLTTKREKTLQEINDFMKDLEDDDLEKMKDVAEAIACHSITKKEKKTKGK